MKYTTFRNLVAAGALALAGLGVWRCTACNEAREEEQRRREAAERAALPVLTSPVPPTSSASSTAGGDPVGADAAEQLRARLGEPADADKIKDMLGGTGVKINVYNEGGVWARAKVDHDRDEKWDEKWHVDGGVVVRQIAPNDDESYTRELRWQGGRWVDPAASAEAPKTEAPAAPAATAGPAANTGRALDAEVIALLSRPVEEKIKDATHGGTPYKINLYSDDRARWNRAKVDLDRDDKWDEKWTFFPDGAVEREVAPADDESYTERYLLREGAWVKK